MSPRMGLTRLKIVDTAGEMADLKGIEYVTIANLAKELKIRPPSLYNHIKGFNELRTEMAVQGLRGLFHEMKLGTEGRKEEDAVQSLGASYMDFARRRPGLYESALLAPDSKNPGVQEAGNKIVGLLLEKLEYLNLSQINALHAVRGLRSMLHGFAALEQKSGFGMDLSVDESLRKMITAFLLGIMA
jgi:AcrR family transcriptional regulator